MSLLKQNTRGSALVLIASCLLPFEAGANAWTQKANFGGNWRVSACGFSLTSTAGKTRGYIGTGWNGNYTRDFWEYDVGTNVWTQKADFAGGARYGCTGVSIGVKGYVGFGVDSIGNTWKNDFWEYDPVSNTWTQKTSLPGLVRKHATGFAVGNKGYITGGGYSNGTTLSDLWEYNQNNDTWTIISNVFPYSGPGRESAVAFSIGTMGYFGTGLDGTGSPYDDWWEFDTGSNTWSQKANVPGSPRFGACGFSIGTKGYLGCGFSVNASYSSDFYQYDPNTNTWATQDSANGYTPWARHYSVGFSLFSKGYMGTGGDGQAGSSDLVFWEFDPALSGNNEIANNISASVYPNPFTAQATFSLSEEQKNAHLKLFSLKGEEEKQITFSGKQVEIERGNLPSGVYFYQVTNAEGKMASGKLIIR